MRRRRRWPLLLILLGITAVILTLLLRPRDTQAEYGSAVALCPGPDSYGYTCTTGDGFAYIDATNDTQLYVEDGTISLPLPFPFTFYGTTYTALNASSNGNIQFGNANAAYFNECLNNGPAPEMGDMIAPYWSDLDLTYSGFLETETVGNAPNRIFVIEWDSVPPYGAELDDRVTFEVQLFEGSSDIVFLYEDVVAQVGSNGRLATIGIQSASQGVALQLGCNQASVSDGGRLHIPHPPQPNPELGQQVAVNPVQPTLAQAALREPVATLVDQLNQRGAAALPRLQQYWQTQRPFRTSEWQWVDVTGDGELDLFMLWRGDAQHPHLTEMALLVMGENGRLTPTFTHRPTTRTTSYPQLHFHTTADLNSDGIDEIILYDSSSHHTLLLTPHPTPQLFTLPAPCQTPPTLRDANGDGQPDLIGRHCATPTGQIRFGWNGHTFAPLP